MKDTIEPLLADRLRAERQTFDAIPVVDVSALVHGGDTQIVAKQFRWALSNVGFMYVKNHGIDAALIDQAFAETKRFFDLPIASKSALHIRNSGTDLRGYIPLFGENTDPTKTRDLKECFDLGRANPGDKRPFFGTNQWPDAVGAFSSTMLSYHSALAQLSLRLLRGIALSLDLPSDYFAPMMTDPINVLRLIHYPPQSGPIDEGEIGIGAHSDYGNITILTQDNVGGLQVLNRDDIWVEAPPKQGTFVINIGDLVQMLTNDQYIANLHRVINTSGRERYSMPFFVEANSDAVFAPLPQCVSALNPARYDPVTCGEHMFSRYKESFPHLQGL
jgi:isopenicillin N synthase-like dioxygenase